MPEYENRWTPNAPGDYWSMQNPIVQDALDRATQLAMGGGGFTKVVRSSIPGGINRIEAFHNTTGEPVGHIGYKQAPGRGGRIIDVKIDPKFQKRSRYAGELINGFIEEMGPLINDIGIAGTITNSPNFWKNLAKRYRDHPASHILDQELEFGGFK